MPDRPLTLTRAAAALGLTRSTVWGLIKRGTLTATQRRVPGHTLPLWFVRPEDVAAYAALRGDRLGKPGRTKGLNPPTRQEG